MRLAFVESLKSHFKDKLDWFGNGINPTADKWKALETYRYTITLENQQADNVITEKLYDAFLAHCYPLYWGAPNAHVYFESSGFSHLNIRDLNGSILLIEEALDSRIAEEAANAVSENRCKVLNELNMFSRLSAIAVDIARTSRSQPQEVCLSARRDERLSRWRGGPRDVSGRALEKLGRLVRQ